MLTTKDRKSLETIAGRSGTRLQVLQCLVPVVLLMLSVLKVWMASRWGHLQGYSLADLIQLFLAGTDPSRSYSGTLIRAEDDLTLALLYLGGAVITLVVAVTGSEMRRRQIRIIAALKRCGEL